MRIETFCPHPYENRLPSCTDLHFIAVCSCAILVVNQLNSMIPYRNMCIAFVCIYAFFGKLDNLNSMDPIRKHGKYPESECCCLPRMPLRIIAFALRFKCCIRCCNVLQSGKILQKRIHSVDPTWKNALFVYCLCSHAAPH